MTTKLTDILAALEKGDTIWKTHRGEFTLIQDMATPHLFNAFRMVYNHSVPPAFRVTGDTNDFMRYDDVKCWSPARLERVSAALLRELKTRTDVDSYDREQLEDIKANTEFLGELLNY